MEDELGELGEAVGPIDSWALRLSGRETVPAYLVSRFAAQYRIIVDVLTAEQDSSLTGLSYDEVKSAIRVTLGQLLSTDDAEELLGDEAWHLDARLERLEQWKVVTRWQEPARSGEDFLRRRDRYQLTPAAAQLHAFWTDPHRTDESAGGDLTLAPRAIHDRLVAFELAVGERKYLAAAGEFQQLAALHQAMATAARGWQRGLAHALSGGPDENKQELLWRTLQAYVATWGEQVDVNTPRIAALLGRLEDKLDETTWRACVRAELSDEAPDELIAEQVKRRLHTWSALSSWFAGPAPQAGRLRRQLRDLVAPWARNMHILMDTGGTVTRRPELLRLAAAIEQAPSDDEAWRLWDVAVGGFAARHLLLPADAADDQVLSWTQAPAVPVTARFRQQGVRAATGRRARTPDYSAGKAAARRARYAELAARRAAEAALRQRSGTTLASWGRIPSAELDLLLELVGTVRRVGTEADGVRSAITPDGRWRISLAAPRPGDTASLSTEEGSLTAPNWRFEMMPG